METTKTTATKETDTMDFECKDCGKATDDIVCLDCLKEDLRCACHDDFRIGSTVKVVRPISRMERDLLGRTFTVLRRDATHGYVVAGDEHGAWHIHPEALEVA
jgi:hypothetical protein